MVKLEFSPKEIRDPHKAFNNFQKKKFQYRKEKRRLTQNLFMQNLQELGIDLKNVLSVK